MQDLNADARRALVSTIEIINSECDLRATGGRSIFGCIERKVDELAIGPRRRGMTSTGPSVVALVVVDVQLESKTVAIELQRLVEVGNLDDHGDKAIGVTHGHILLDDAGQR